MHERALSRRRFFTRSALGAAALGVSAMGRRRAFGASERLSIGIIGCGGRGSALMGQIHSLSSAHDVEITAVCDVWRVSLGRAAAAVEGWFGTKPHQSTRFGEQLALDNVDAVVIATPDFGHAAIMIAALNTGKDVYVEKPMSLEISEATEALDLAREKKRIVQAGTQRRSEGAYRAAAKELAAGALGHISRISTAVCFNEARWARNYADCRESDVDWEAYLFNRPPQPFDPKLLRRWQLYRECTNGLSGLWMSHYVDTVNMLTGACYPASAVAHGGRFVWDDGREHCDNFHALLEYPERFLFDWGMSLTNSTGGHFTVHGTEGTLDVDDWTISPEGGRPGTKLVARKIAAEPNENHMGNWLECLRSRHRPNADIQYGHQHAVGTIMAAAALHTGCRQRYDTERREARAG